ncbi:putative pentatricopeptide repeat-containing protein At1g03510 [Euphorbia lathyris]|uniref:putative pentatricopeptide repeat-containing protein At1g03510 n=1 Tax=Euphorbia lathyris TaxID=212925 RepID=UPI0033134E1C
MSYSSNNQRLFALTKKLTSHVNQGLHHEALSLFHRMHTILSLSLDAHVFSLVLKSCSSVHCPQLGTALHSHVFKLGFLSNPFVACSLVDMYGKCVDIFSARKLFDEIPSRNVVVWNAMISLYTHSSRVDDALDLFNSMNSLPNSSTFNAIIAGFSGTKYGSSKAIAFYWRMREFNLKPNLITLLALLPACVDISALNLIKEIHGYSIRNDIDPHPQLRSGLTEAYGQCGCLDNASTVFYATKEKDVVAWSSLISAYALNGEARAALGIFRQMEMAKVWPNDITFLAVLKACSHAGLSDEAFDYFTKMREMYDLKPSSNHYSCLVDVLSRAGRLQEAYKVIQQMPVKVNAGAWGALLGGCRTYGEVELAEVAGRALVEIEPDNPANYVLLARTYAGVGRHEEAHRIRREMKERGVMVAPRSSWIA